MIWCVGLNPAWDVVMGLDPARGPEGVRVAAWTEATPGGKANNVARVVRQLGQPATAVGLYGGAVGELVQQGLREAGVHVLAGVAEGATRICLTELDGPRRREVRGRGPEVHPSQADALLQRVLAAAQSNDLVALSGSVPPGLAPGVLAHWVAALKPHVRFMALDAAGDELAAAWQAAPDLAVPNLAEYRALGRSARDGAGPRWVAVTRGTAGLSWRERGRWHHIPAPPATPANATGAGDALLGGVLAALAQGAPLSKALALGVSVGTASVATRGVAVLPAEAVQTFRTAVAKMGFAQS